MNSVKAPAAMSRGFVIFVSLVVGAGTAVIGHSLLRLPEVPTPLAWVALTALAMLSGTFTLKVPGVPAYLSISDTFFVATGLLFGPAPAALTIALDSLVVSLRRHNRLRQMAFNATSCAVALWSGVHVYHLLGGATLDSLTTGGLDAVVLPLAGLAAVYFLLNSGFTATAVALSKGERPWTFWRQHFAVMSMNYFAATSAAALLIALARSVGIGALALVSPLLLICYFAMRSWLGRVADAQEHVQHVNRLHMSTISAFSTAIEAKDGVTSDHIHRVQAYAMGLAREMGIDDEPTLRGLEAAALLHDTGKLAIPEHILNKPGKLTAQEFETMKAHVDIGAGILSSIEFPYPVVPIVRAHHENWNGSGYPNGLKGEDIPIGARILSVVDCFDALTSDRPYRPALSDEAALEIIQQSRGTMYDPAVVDTFMRVCRKIAPDSLPESKLEGLMHLIRGVSAEPAAAPAAAAPAAAVASPAQSELLAFVSLARLAGGTPTVSDIGALAQGHLRHVAPHSTIALFTLEGGGVRLSAQFASGPAASLVTPLVMRVGDRLTGWVGANASAMRNGDGRLDLPGVAVSDVRWASAVPLIADGTLAGVLTVYTAEPLADDSCRMLEMIAPHLASAVASATASSANAAPGVPARHRASSLRVVASR